MTHFRRKALTGLLLAGLVAGCSSSVTLQAPSIPMPLTTKIPATVGLRMPANFQSFVHQEKVYGREEWSIDLGDANAKLFSDLFGHMFGRVEILTAEQDPLQYDLDALIEPEIDAFEFSVPNQSKTDSFAVWIRYKLKVYDSSGDLVTEWPVAAYGKSQTASVSNAEALRRAAVLAMRDAAALMIMKLDEVTQISTLAADRAAADAPAVVPSADDANDGDEDDVDDVQSAAVEGQDDEAG